MLAQTPTARMQQPFIQALAMSTLSALMIIGAGALAFRKTGLPLLEELKTELRVRREAEAKLAEHQEHLEHLVQARTEALQRAQGELVKTERLATLGKLTATVSHELRNPLGTLRNSLYSIRQQLGREARGLERVLARAERSAARCDAIIDELLLFTRNRAPKPTVVELSGWLREMVLEYEVPGGFRVNCNFSENCCAYVDPEDLRRCVVNLLSNAAHAASAAGHSPATGMIRIFTGKYEIEKFNGKNDFSYWRMQMQNLLISQKLHKTLHGKQKHKDMSDADWEELDLEVRASIIICLERDIAFLVDGEKMIMDVWSKLESNFMMKTLTNWIYLKSRLYTCKMKEGTLIREYINKFDRILSDLKDIVMKIEDEDQTLLLLLSLPNSYENLIHILLLVGDNLTIYDDSSLCQDKVKSQCFLI